MAELNLSVVPTGVKVEMQDLSDEISACLMLITTPTGIFGVFLSDEQALSIGNQMLNIGQQIRKKATGLQVVKRPGIVVPGSHNEGGS